MDRRSIRKAMSPAGWTALLYYLLINVCVYLTTFLDILLGMLSRLQQGSWDMDMDAILNRAMSNAWGYFLAAAVGIAIVLAWKKPEFWRQQIWARGKPVKPGDFLGILCIFISGQFVYQFLVIALETALNAMGLTMMYGLEALSAGSDSFSMFLYMGILAPVTEELLCRGLIQRTLMPWGKRMAILGSAFLFGMFHGNLIQAPYAFAVGLVLGYVAAEYSIAWAMVLHMINNLVLGDMLTRLTAGMTDTGASLVIWGILLLFALGAVVTLVRKHGRIRAWMADNPLYPGLAGCFFSSGGVITFTVVMALSMIVACFALVTPI